MIIKDLNINDYHFAKPYSDYLGSTNIKNAQKSLKNFKWHLDHIKNERKIHFDFGNAFEIALLDKHNFKNSVAIFDELKRPEPEMSFGSKKNKEYKADFYAKNINKYILSKSDLEVLELMLSSCRQNENIAEAIKDYDYQISMFWEQDNLKLKSRPDIIKKDKGYIIDVKTCDDASPKGAAKAISNFGYTIQALLQIDGAIKSGYMDEVKYYFWLFVEKKPPYDAQLYLFDDEDREIKKMSYNLVLQRLSEAYRTNEFPGYSEFALNDKGILTAKIY